MPSSTLPRISRKACSASRRRRKPRRDRWRRLDALAELERDPDAGYELRSRLAGLWSYRVGVYRIIYERRDPKTVRVVAIRHRGQAYEWDPRQ